MDTKTCELLLEIARCPIAKQILGKVGDPVSGCEKIVLSQRNKNGLLELGQFQAPTPWVGHLEEAPILFLSSNPSINTEEVAALSWSENWNEDRIVDYFENLFSGEWTDKERLRMLRKTPEKHGLYGKHEHWVRYWASIRRRAAELLDRGVNDVRPGQDYALTEMVRCKSTQEIGVTDALHTCLGNYFTRTLAQAKNLRVMVAFGDIVFQGLRKYFPISDQVRIGSYTRHSLEQKEHYAHIEQITLSDGRNVWLAFLPHPNRRKTLKNFQACVTKNELNILREALKR